MAAGFRIQAKAVLFTWNVTEPKSAQEALDELSTKIQWENVLHYTVCAEEGTHWHLHAYIEFKSRIDNLVNFWNLWGVTPHVSPNTTSGSGFSQAVRRGSFYVANEYKKTFRSHAMNFRPCEHYSVKTQWVIDQWSQEKLRDPIECAGRYNCLTQPFKTMVSLSQGSKTTLARREFYMYRELELAQRQKPFKEYPALDLFRGQFATVASRYNFMWIWGDSKLGKTELAKSLSVDFWHHRNSIDWQGYDPLVHRVIIFDDVAEPEQYIMHHKMLFQANCISTVNCSKTNCFALQIDTGEKMLVVCSNTAPYTDWVTQNAYVLHVTEPTWA